MILVHVAQFLKDDPGAHRELEFQETDAYLGDVQLAAPLEGSAELVRTQRGNDAISRSRYLDMRPLSE